MWAYRFVAACFVCVRLRAVLKGYSRGTQGVLKGHSGRGAVQGPYNIQCLHKDGQLKVIETNLRCGLLYRPVPGSEPCLGRPSLPVYRACGTHDRRWKAHARLAGHSALLPAMACYGA